MGAQGASVFKAFNSIGQQYFGKGDSSFSGRQADMLFAGGKGDAPASKEELATLEKIISDGGFTPVYAGPIRFARNLESLAELWVGMSYVTGTAPGGGKGFAFFATGK